MPHRMWRVRIGHEGFEQDVPIPLELSLDPSGTPGRGGGCTQAVQGWEQGWVIPIPPHLQLLHTTGRCQVGTVRVTGSSDRAGTVPLCLPREPEALWVTCPFPVSLLWEGLR